VNRLIVLGGFGHFGRTAVEELRSMGLDPLVASRRPSADIRVDAGDPESLRAAFAEGDLVIDAVGPFQDRAPVLVEAALDKGFDVIDIGDDLGYAERVFALGERIVRAGIRVLNACSTVSAVSACLVAESGCARPVRVSGFLAPAARRAANPASALSLLRSVGRPVRAVRGGCLATLRGWSEARTLALDGRTIRGRLFESADALHLPRRWPTLASVSLYLDPNVPGLAALLGLAARYPRLRSLLERHVALGSWLSRLVGSATGAFACEVEAESGETSTAALVAPETGHVVPIAPTVLAARAIAEGRFTPRGLVPPDRHVDPAALWAYLNSRGIGLQRPGSRLP
jgi:hypothetical protein